MDDTGLEFKIKLNDEPTQSKLENYSSLNQNDNLSQANTKVSVPIYSEQPRGSDSISISSSSYDLQKASHPQACIFTFFFKLLAVLSYICLAWFNTNRITIFIVCVIFTAFDFWVVKNVTGRLLVGLRWSSEYTQDGTEVWSFSSHDDNREANKVDSAFFWSSQISAVIVWGIFGIANLLTLQIFWTCLNAIVLCLSCINFYGFYKCRGEHQKKISGVKDELTKKGMNFIGNMMLKSKFGG